MRSRPTEMGFVNWCCTKDNDNDEYDNSRNFKGLQFEKDTTGTDRSSDPFLLEHRYSNREIDTSIPPNKYDQVIRKE